MPKQKLGKKLSFDILESTAPPKPQHQKSRKPENQRSRKVENQSWKTGKTQISLWLPDKLVESLKIEAAKQKKKLSTLAAEKLTRTVEK